MQYSFNSLITLRIYLSDFKNLVIIFILTLSFSFAFGQDTVLNKTTFQPIISSKSAFNDNIYSIGGNRIRHIRSYLLKFPSSEIEIKKANQASLGGIISLGVGTASTIYLFTEKRSSSKLTLFYCTSIPSILGIIYFGMKQKFHFKNAIKKYNENL